MINKFLFYMVVIMLFMACDNKKVYDEYQRMENHNWPADDIVSFDVNIQDTVSANNIFLNIRNENSYPYRNLFLFISITDPSGQFKKDTVELFLADEKGKWHGKGVGSAFQNKIPLLSKVRFQYQGIYTFEIEQAMRREKLPGILDVGLRIERLKQ